MSSQFDRDDAAGVFFDKSNMMSQMTCCTMNVKVMVNHQLEQYTYIFESDVMKASLNKIMLFQMGFLAFQQYICNIHGTPF